MYVNWEEKAIQAIETLRWYRVSEVIKYLHDLRTFVIDTPGKYSPTYLPQLYKIINSNKSEENENEENVDNNTISLNSFKLPASKTSRFANDTYWLCEAIGDWSLKLDILALTANVMINANRLERSYPDFTTAGDTEYHAIYLINEVLRLIEKEAIDQRRFEEKYGLTWKV
ncbi:MAG: hypothetical protein EXX96DRAFT_549360 [Benjaminiella poitrasii]|nr:MAG: hypothetical protein EXX96DRAFT_549360 [Benjaminiella poitrasii]